MIYQAGLKAGPYKIAGVHDPDNTRPMTLRFKPGTWAAGTVYERTSDQSYDVVFPSTYKGLMYIVVNPGKSHATTEPTWALTIDDITEDFEAGKTDGLTFQAKANTMLQPSENISSFTTTLTNDVTVSSETSTSSTISFTIDAIASDADARTARTFNLECHVVTTVREFDITLQFKLGDW